jgi:hypothetical protein
LDAAYLAAIKAQYVKAIRGFAAPAAEEKTVGIQGS